ncbi:replication-relaxation family protein [Nocardia sp. NPDC050697]|uniref:replication-relaxation family protein n=1 Tax=Nocardia sp. NPDC050697 TaxID=3155158 RepID=UPI0033E2583D
MIISPRDDRILRQVLRFGQLGAGHIRELEFYGLKSDTSADNVLKRLVGNGLLARVERRSFGGYRGGSGQYIYQLGVKGYRYLDRMDARHNYRVQKRHMLGLADVYVSMVRASRTGELEIKTALVEEEATIDVDGVTVIPDLYARLWVAARQRAIQLYIEVDMGSSADQSSESPDKIRDKLKRYYYASTHWDEPTFPLVLFLAIDAERASTLRHIISKAPEHVRPLFRVETMESFPQLLWSE